MPPPSARRALARLAATVGGSDHPPRLERLERLHAALIGGLSAGRTLGRCRFLPWRGSVLVCRETASAEPPRSALPGTSLWWDGRFVISLAPQAPGGLTVGALGSAGLGRRDIQRSAPAIPAAARATLPALRDLVGIVSVPHLNYVRPDVARASGGISPPSPSVRTGRSLLRALQWFSSERILSGRGSDAQRE